MPEQRQLHTRQIGDRGEDVAAGFLKRQGYQILERNYRTNFGEVDIIARNGDYLVFVEVKYRTSLAYGHPYEAVDKWKLVKLRKLVERYCLKNKTTLLPRIEVLSIWKDEEGKQQIKHIKGIVF